MNQWRRVPGLGQLASSGSKPGIEASPSFEEAGKVALGGLAATSALQRPGAIRAEAGSG